MLRILKNKGLTLIEILVVIVIIILLTAVTFINYGAIQDNLNLNMAANKLAQDMRKVQEMTMSAEEWDDEVPEGGYGISFNINDQGQYILFADKGPLPDRDYTDDNEKIKTIEFEDGVEICKLEIKAGQQYKEKTRIQVVFEPPDPVIYINGDNELGSEAKITICLTRDIARTKVIKVNAVGLITIE